MTEQDTRADEATRLDFDARYRGDFDAQNRNEWVQAAGIKVDFLPWDIGEPQPALCELERSGQIRSEVLDTGCGLGDNDLFLAERGYRVFGVDIASAAVERARARAQSRGLDMEFAVADTIILKGYESRFATVINCGLYEVWTEQQRKTYLTTVHHACQPAARLHLLCMTDATPLNFLNPYGISETNLRDSLTSDSGWAIRSLTHTRLTMAFTRHYIEQQAGTAARDAFDWARLVYDQQGRLLIPAWVATAERSSDHVA